MKFPASFSHAFASLQCDDGPGDGCAEFAGAGFQTSDCASASDVQARITIEVTGGEKNVPIENASVYVKFIEEHSLKKDKKLEMNVKTSPRRHRHVPSAPMGRVLVQLSPKMEDLRTLARHHRSEADHQGASREAAEVVLKGIRGRSLRINSLRKAKERFALIFIA